MIACDCEVCTSTDKKDKRLRSSILVQSHNNFCSRYQVPIFVARCCGKHIKHLDAVIFTHPHKDHLAGLDDVRAFNFFDKKPMEVYANSMTEETLSKRIFLCICRSKYPGIPEINFNTITTDPFFIGDIPVIPVFVWHLRMPVLGFRFGKFTYITDANRIDEAEKEKIKGSEIIVLNALRKKEHISHFNLSQAIEMAQELKATNTYFTHISHQLGRHAEIEAELPDHIHLAYDRQVIEFA